MKLILLSLSLSLFPPSRRRLCLRERRRVGLALRAEGAPDDGGAEARHQAQAHAERARARTHRGRAQPRRDVKQDIG